MYGGGKRGVPVVERCEAVFNQVLGRAVVEVRVVLVDHALEPAAAQSDAVNSLRVPLFHFSRCSHARNFPRRGTEGEERVRGRRGRGRGRGWQLAGQEEKVRIPDDREQAREQRKEVASSQDGVAEDGLDTPIGFRSPLRMEDEREKGGKPGLGLVKRTWKRGSLGVIFEMVGASGWIVG
jgi:hypothetical protein